ncbi:hypothetical protein B0H12DRAFT_1182143 [Mycena haematopus]|nr:hypothetical protein B0H12DRAFT_1182143 [Mycena haematopus]
MPPSSFLLSRLYKDLAELHESPYPGVAVFIDDANVRKFCLVLTPPSGPWKNLSLHFDVVLPDDWPILPPKISCSVDGVDHPNLFGSYICCDLLKTKAEIYQGGDGYTGGYSPALTLRGLFLQFLTFFTSTKIDQDYGGLPIDIGDSVVVSFIRESDLPRRTKKVKFSDTAQDKLRREWEKDKHAVVVIREEATEIGPLLETTKSSRPSPDRLHRIEEKNYRWTSTFKSIRYWQCKSCPYGTDAVPHCVGAAAQAATDVDQSTPLLTPPAVCQLGLLNDDDLWELASRLPSESLITFGAAYPRLHNIIQSTHMLLQRELRCFFLRTPLSDSVLGIGVALNFRARTLSSDFDWLSERAFVEFGIRESIEKREFAFFLPLAFSQPHFARVVPRIWTRLTEINLEVQRAEEQMSRNPRNRSATPQRHEVICVVYRMMTNIVVSLMKSCDDAFSVIRGGPSNTSRTLLHASEKALVAYCHLFHLLVNLCRTEPHIVSDATKRLARFIERKDGRVKTAVPDLGELIILIMVVMCCPSVAEASGGAPITWESFVDPFLEEVNIRNVRWALKDAPHLEVMEQGSSDYRLAETFFRSKTSLRLVMFQVTFLNVLQGIYGSNLSRLDDNYGFPEKELPERMVEEVKPIYDIDTWPGFFARVRFPQGIDFGKEKYSDMLREAVKTSAARRYHTPAPINRLQWFRGQRKWFEEESARRLSKAKDWAREEEVFRPF